MPDYTSIGTTLGGLTPLTSLTTPLFEPYVEFSEHSAIEEAVSGMSVGNGFPVLSWSWGFLPIAQYDQIRILIPGLSAQLFVKTFIPQTRTWKTYETVAHIPQKIEMPQTLHVVQPFSITFTHLVEQ